jgi:two-component system KDP operon response regulator KdpE
MNKKILVLDWEAIIPRRLLAALETADYQLFYSSERADGLRQILLNGQDLAILGIRGSSDREWAVCRVIRDLSAVPLVIVTSRNESALCVRALEYGADDCVHSGCSSEEFAARVHVLLRRTSQISHVENNGHMHTGDVSVNLASHHVTVREQRVDFSGTEYRLLLYLLNNAGRAVSTQELLRQIWGPGHRHRPEYPRMYVRALRRKLGDSADNPKYIQSIHGMGYRWAVPVTRVTTG